MHASTRLGLAALAAGLLLACAVSTVSARSYSINSQTIRATWSRLEFQSALFTIRCPVTIEGSYHTRTIDKVIGRLKGALRRVDIKNESCTGGTVAIERPPFHWVQERFTGTLPNITSVSLLMARVRFTFTALGVRCSYGTETDKVNFTSNLNASGEVTSFVPDATNLLHRVEGEGLCPETGNLAGTEGQEMVAGSTTRIRITLI